MKIYQVSEFKCFSKDKESNFNFDSKGERNNFATIDVTDQLIIFSFAKEKDSNAMGTIIVPIQQITCVEISHI